MDVDNYPMIGDFPRALKPTRPLSRLLLLALLATSLGACSMIELGYSQAPTLIANRLDEAFDLDDKQYDRLKSRLGDFHDWHRTEEVARYEQILLAAAERAEAGVTAADIVWLVDRVREARDRFTGRLIDDLADLALDLRPRQIERFRQYRARDLQEDLEERRDSDWRDELVERRLERIEDWTGAIDDDLKDRINARLAEIPDRYEDWGRYRQSRDNLLADTLRDSRDVDQLKQRLRYALIDPAAEFRIEFENRRQSYWREYSAAIAEIVGWLPPEQRRAVVDKLREYARIARSIGT